MTPDTTRTPVDHYGILGLDITAAPAPEVIRKAFYSLAKEVHPDRNPGDSVARARYDQAVTAYRVLSDPERRQEYDSRLRAWYGHPLSSQGRPGVGARPPLTRPETGGGWRARLSGRPTERPVEPATTGDPVRLRLAVTLAEMRQGGSRRVVYWKAMACGACDGGTTSGAGACGPCGARGVVPTRCALTLRIRSGVRPGDWLVFAGQGAQGRAGAPPGDLRVNIELLPTPGVRLDGLHVWHTLPLTVAQAQQGTLLDVELPGGGRRAVPVPAGVPSGWAVRLPGEGLGDGSGGFGDYHLRVALWIPPAHLTDGRDGPAPQPDAAWIEQAEAALNGGLMTDLPA